jgi:RIO-like serine/threonine protein kinase
MPVIPIIIENKGHKTVKSHDITDTEKKIYRELQWLSEMTPIEELQERFYRLNPKDLNKSLQKLTRLKFISMFDLSKFGQKGIMVMAN